MISPIIHMAVMMGIDFPGIENVIDNVQAAFGNSFLSKADSCKDKLVVRPPMAFRVLSWVLNNAHTPVTREDFDRTSCLHYDVLAVSHPLRRWAPAWLVLHRHSGGSCHTATVGIPLTIEGLNGPVASFHVNSNTRRARQPQVLVSRTGE